MMTQVTRVEDAESDALKSPGWRMLGVVKQVTRVENAEGDAGSHQAGGC